MKYSPNNNPIPFTIGVYNQEPITYKHPYTFCVTPITLQYTSSRYANIKCFYFTLILHVHLMIMFAIVINYLTYLSIK